MTSHKNAILAAAESLFSLRGYAATTVRDIVKEAGVKAPALYYHFGSKESLFVDLFKSRLDAYTQLLNEALEPANNGRELFLANAEFIMNGIRTNPVSVRFIFGTYFGPREGIPQGRIIPAQAAYQDILPRHLLRVEPGLEPERARFGALLFHGMMASAILLFIGYDIRDFPEELASAIADRAAAILEDDGDVPAWPMPVRRVEEMP